ncbi:synaptonemal complex protein 2-like isoform X3 [Coturnix japonica]|nr:synaptonemal complex protein 2-like isoform X3 [Coturnix japonica]XP_015710088.1 synaptonemal complex protein 2-like isoform X3 [Coturnix japonica]XP_015710089.1 synaptonemal complex protein 2-like isoform X3 [Coturnix japonica]
MAAHAEDYLESLLIDAFKGKGYQKISDLLQETETDTLQKYSNSLLSQLDKALRRELDRNDFHNVSLLLKCMQLYFKSDLQQGTSLFVEQGLIEKMVSWFERARTFVILIDPTENSFLMVLLEDFFDFALAICRCSNEGKKQLVDSFLPELGRLVTETSICCALRQEALRTLNCILDSIPREGRKKLPLSEEVCFLTKDLAKTMLEAGDYDLQVALSEALCRLTIKKWRDDLVNHWFEDKYLAEAFKEIKDKEFETDCRKFLNQLNERLGDKRRVYSLPCLSAFADVNQVKKPSDEKLDKFWIDFNTGSHSVTFYIDSTEGVLWDSVRLQKEAVSCYSLKEDGGEKIVRIYMKIPVTLNKTEATKIKLHFSAEYEILSILKKVLGDEKMMTNVGEEESIHTGKQTRQNEEVTPQSSDLQKRKDPENSENVEPIPGNLISQHKEQLVGTVAQKTPNSDVTVIAVNQQSGLDEADQGSANKPRTLSPRMDVKSSEKPQEEKLMEASVPKKVGTFERRTRSKGLVKQKTGGRKDSYDFEVSDSASHETVAEAKGKVLGMKSYSQNQSYRMHLFSESNNEKTSNSESEKSWILNSQKASVPKSLNYTRKRHRMRRKLKVLPVSSPSSSNENQVEERGAARQKDEKKTSRKKSTSTSKRDDLPTVDLAGEVPSEEPEGTWQPPDVSMEEHSVEEAATQKFHNVSGEKTREEERFKRKDSDALSGTVVKKPRIFSWETNHLSSESPLNPKKPLYSVEEEEEIKRGQETIDVNTAFLPKMQHKDIGDSGVIAVFESFTNQLKQLFWSRYKEMEMSAQNTLKTSEKNVSALLKEIHKCRLNKLEDFKQIVVEELASLEKDTQILRSMEKDAVDFWNAQLYKLNSFCNQQKQRIQSVDSALGETAENFSSTTVNTTHNDSMKSVVENGVFVVPSD